MIVFLCALVGAVCRRICGGADSALSVIEGRLVWAVPTGFLCGVAADEGYIAIICILTAYAGLMIPHAWAQNRDSFLSISTIGMSAVWLGRGILLGAPAYVLTGAVWWPLLIAAALTGPARWLGWRTPSNIPNLSAGTNIGEAFEGALILAGIAISGHML